MLIKVIGKIMCTYNTNYLDMPTK